ncbi:MAG: 5-formyltetrahydrofolate cyclo-ligase [Sandaracinaceae bacterium]
MDETAYFKSQVKDEIRTRRRALRRAFPEAARQARSAAIAARVIDLPEWGTAKTVLAFLSMRTEVQTAPLIEAAWAANKRVAATRITESSNGGPSELALYEHTRERPTVLAPMGFAEPDPDAPRVSDDEVDLVIVPALAVDDRGYRIGYGKGYYDRLLPRLRDAFFVAVVFDFERITEVPNHDGDVPVHAIVTDAHTIRVTPANGAKES